MSILLKSILRSEIKHWLLIGALSLWGFTATIFAFSKHEKVTLIGLDDSGARIITSQSDRVLKTELQKFVLEFLNLYYSYDEKNFNERVGKAADLFTEELWNQEKGKLYELNKKLQKIPLTQSIQVESIDLIENGKMEAVLAVLVKSRLAEHKVRLKVSLEYKVKERTETNPWNYVITDIKDAVL